MLCFNIQKSKQKAFFKWPSLAAGWSGIKTITGNGIFVCYDDNQKQPASNSMVWCVPFLKDKQSKQRHGLKKQKKNVFESFHNGFEKYWKYQYISIYFLILNIDICVYISHKTFILGG